MPTRSLPSDTGGLPPWASDSDNCITLASDEPKPRQTGTPALTFMKIQQSKRPGPPTALRRAPPSRAEGG